MLVKEVIEQIKRNKEMRESGKDISIPFPFPRFSKHIPGIQKGRYYIVTANQKVGKTKLTDFLFFYNPLEFVKNKQTNIKVKIIYFSLEMSKEDKVKEFISYFLFKKEGIRIPPDMIDSSYHHYILNDKILNLIESYKEEIESYLENVIFIDNIRNPFGIYKTVREYAHSHGHYEDINGVVLDTHLIERGEDEVKRIHKYVPDDEDEYIIVITDHLNLLTPEHGENLRNTIERFSSQYCLNIRDRWKYIVVNVQQQAASQESLDNYQANLLRPSANGLGDNKVTSRDCDVLIGLFAPVRFKKSIWEGYNIQIMKDLYREISVILNRRGYPVTSDLFFDGAVNYFKELPSIENIDEDKFYQGIREYQKKIQNGETQFNIR